MSGRTRGKSRVRRASSTQLAFPQTGEGAAPILEYTNGRQFEAIRAAQPLVLFYKDNEASEANPSVFDPELDERLVELHAEPYELGQFTLAGYEACVTRASYECRPHPDQDTLVGLVRDEVAGIDPATVVVLVYRRDDSASSPARARWTNPFRNTINGCVDGAPSQPLVFFTQFAFEPAYRAQIIWHREPTTNSTIGLIGVRYMGQI